MACPYITFHIKIYLRGEHCGAVALISSRGVVRSSKLGSFPQHLHGYCCCSLLGIRGDDLLGIQTDREANLQDVCQDDQITEL